MHNAINNLKTETLINMDPESLNMLLHNEIDISIPTNIDTSETKAKAVETLNKTIAYTCYLKELETLTRVLKRKAKRVSNNTKEVDRLLSCEEIFETYKRNCEKIYDYISKLMTMKRLTLDEMKMLGHTV